MSDEQDVVQEGGEPKANPWHDSAGLFTGPGGAASTSAWGANYRGGALGSDKKPVETASGGSVAKPEPKPEPKPAPRASTYTLPNGTSLYGTPVDDAYFATGAGSKLFDESMKPQHREKIQKVLIEAKVPREHLVGMGKFSTQAHASVAKSVAGSWLDKDGKSFAGLYEHKGLSDSVIYLHPTVTGSPEFVLHELGHHVRIGSVVMLRDSTKGLKNAKRGTSADRSRAGLRSYSLTSVDEFAADSYLVAFRGRPSQTRGLAAIWGQRSMSDVISVRG